MNIDRIKQLKMATPFQPFYVLLENGERLLVEKSYEIGIAPDGSRLGISGDSGVVLLWPKTIKGIDLVTKVAH